MIANARARSPTSSRARSSGNSTGGPPTAIRKAPWRSCRRRRTSVAASGIARIRVSAAPARAAVMNALRTVATASLTSSMGLRTATTQCSGAAPGTDGGVVNASAARTYSVPSIDPNVYHDFPVRNAFATSS